MLRPRFRSSSRSCTTVHWRGFSSISVRTAGRGADVIVGCAAASLGRFGRLSGSWHTPPAREAALRALASEPRDPSVAPLLRLHGMHSSVELAAARAASPCTTASCASVAIQLATSGAIVAPEEEAGGAPGASRFRRARRSGGAAGGMAASAVLTPASTQCSAPKETHPQLCRHARPHRLQPHARTRMRWVLRLHSLCQCHLEPPRARAMLGHLNK